MLTHNVTDEISLPHEAGTIITIRMLSHGALKKARDSRLKELAQMIGGIDFSSIKREEEETSKKTEDDPLAGYDITTVLHKGIKSWSYTEKCSPENIDELDDVSAEFIAKAIINLSRRTVAEGEASSVE